MGYDLLRKGRFSERNRAYFVTTVTHGRKRTFEDFYCARILINTMKRLDEQNYVSSYSFVVMPDHVHWLFQLGDSASLSDVMKKFKSISAQHINKYIGQGGCVWQKAFYDRAIRDGEDVKQISRYIIANPLRSGLVENIELYSHWDACWL